jgi:hypothetical protein
MPVNYKDYHPLWSYISLLVRHNIAQWHCEWCAVPHGSQIKDRASRVVLTVAHIDHDKENNSLENLAALCQSCHLGHDRGQHMDNRSYGRNWKKAQIALFDAQEYVHNPCPEYTAHTGVKWQERGFKTPYMELPNPAWGWML